MFLMLCTRPDIANAFGCAAKYCENYDNSHLVAVFIRYLNTTKNSRCRYRKRSQRLLWCQLGWWFGHNNVNYWLHYEVWRKSRQLEVSTTTHTCYILSKAEYMCLAVAMQEVIWLKRILSSLKMYQVKYIKTIKLQSHWLRIIFSTYVIIKDREFELIYVPTIAMHADIMMKFCHAQKVLKYRFFDRFLTDSNFKLFENDVKAMSLIEDSHGKVLEKNC